jgi:hypothetical protein
VGSVKLDSAYRCPFTLLLVLLEVYKVVHFDAIEEFE